MTTVIPPGIVLDYKKPYVWLGPKDDWGHEWARQDGLIFAWSESNTRYETAWWLTTDGAPRVGQTIGQRQQIERIAQHRPFDPIWLEGA